MDDENHAARSLRAAPFPGPLTAEVPVGQPYVAPGPGKPWFREPWFYVAGGAGLIVAVIVVFVVVAVKDRVACLGSPPDQAYRVADLDNAYINIYNRDGKTMDACTSLDCERPLKLEVAAALKTYNAGLSQECWSNGRLKADADALIAVNTATINAYTSWAGAASDTEDQALGSIADQKDREQDAADQKLADDLGIPTVSPSP